MAHQSKWLRKPFHKHMSKAQTRRYHWWLRYFNRKGFKTLAQMFNDK